MTHPVTRRLAGTLALAALLAACTPDTPGTSPVDGAVAVPGEATAISEVDPPMSTSAANYEAKLGCAAFDESSASLNIAFGDVLVALDEGCPDVEVQFVDARVPSEYELGHLPGALNAPYHTPAPHFATLPKDKWLLTYCACPNAEASQLANALVKDGGFTRVRYIDEGMSAWTETGHPMVTGTEPGSLDG